MKAITCKGKHADLCRAIADGNREDALQLIYAFFRSEDNTDSYSISLLTMVRELLEEGDSDELYRIRIRMRSSGDRVFINMAQFVWAFETGGYDVAAETLAEKCLSEMPKFRRSMQEFLDEEGLSKATEMAGLRIREAARILRLYFSSRKDGESCEKIDEVNLEMTRIFLFTNAVAMSEDLMKAAKCANHKGDTMIRDRYCREIFQSYGDVIERIERATEFSREDYEILPSVRYACETLAASESASDAPYADMVSRMDHILSAKA